MASGMGAFSGTGRCFPFFRDITECVNQTENPRFDCVQPRNDYLECLHRWKEIKRSVAIMEEVQKQNAEKAHGKPADGHAHGH